MGSREISRYAAQKKRAGIFKVPGEVRLAPSACGEALFAIKAANAPISAVFLHHDCRGLVPETRPVRYHGMENQASFENLRALLTLARQLRTSAAQTSDITYIGLFLKTARAPEERADRLALPVCSLREGERRAGARQH